MLAQEICLPSKQVPFDDSPSEQGLSGQAPSVQEQFRVVPSALKPLEHIPTGEGRNAEPRVPSVEAPSAVPDWEDVVDPPGAGSPTPLEVLTGHGVETAAEEAARAIARESPRISPATEILETEEDTPSEEEEVQSVRGTPTGVLCEQMVPIPRYLDCKATKYGDPRQCGSYVELVQNRTRIKVATNPELMVLDKKYPLLEERYNFLHDHCALSRKLQKTTIQLRDEMCDELRTQRAAAELQLGEVEGHNRRATNRTREELVSWVDRCLRGYARWEIAARERMTLRELEMRATALMAGDERSRRRVAKRLESFLSRSRSAIANLEAEVTKMLRRLGLRSRADEWTGTASEVGIPTRMLYTSSESVRVPFLVLQRSKLLVLAAAVTREQILAAQIKGYFLLEVIKLHEVLHDERVPTNK
ncbi:hypothetical protein AXG93_3546s1000 [Marchantia polymorpha subsp. ruderalis]|uniref:Uncharacterized protein n=1 Tax=Marchantia polymorpha subsp. ruderalis TaxID=1480154 RepID=A0A176WSU0_MARPO|nr:hypothetical protein AXG93_3546s1000 [Marchantia polymorpha subsp. ruderalis]